MRQGLLVATALAAFAGNSLLCRLALQTTAIDAASFTAIRVAAGAVALCAIVWARGGTVRDGGTWPSAMALMVYMVGFSFAYTRLPTGVGALLLFGAVQVTMIGAALHAGDRLRSIQWVGIGAAITGLVALLLPGLAAPSPTHSALMLTAGVAWGVYSIRGRVPGDPIVATAGNFCRAVPFAAALLLVAAGGLSPDRDGALYAIASGALASGAGYAVWYAALPGLRATSAATIQLAVPVIAALGGVVVLGETVTARLLLSACVILGGIALIVGTGAKPPPAATNPARSPPSPRTPGS